MSPHRTPSGRPAHVPERGARALAARHRGAALAVLLTATLPACALDGLLLTELTRKGHQPMPEPAPVRISGRAPGIAGATVRLLAGDAVIATAQADATDNAAFVVETDGKSAHTNPLVEATAGARQALGVLPSVPGQTSVLAPAIELDVAQLSPGMAALDTRTTTLALLVIAKARGESRALAAIPATSMTDTLIELNDRLVAGDQTLGAVGAMVQRLASLPGGITGGAAPYQLTGGGSLLNVDALGSAGFDYTGDGAADTTSAAFDAALSAAAASFAFKACYVPDRIRVVLLARMTSGAKNGNCEAFDPFLWAKDLPGKRMFVTGGVHVDTPRCVGAGDTHCLTEAQIDAVNESLGNWQPNRARMYDDGTGGDAVAGDGVWTFSFDVPWWDPATSPTGAGVRLAYKFTWGNDGDGWTNTEEFPGNQRILELADKNGDRIIVRQDMFADETSNKDKANQLAPSAGGCGELKWVDQQREGCATDVHERKVDLDGDCVVDGWPSPGKNTALTLPCE